MNLELDEHYRQYKAFVLHDHLEMTGGANFVPGSGITEGRPFAFVAEAPGEREDEYEEPLIGAAGGLLRRALNEIGFPTKRFYTNVWKWRPPKNRTPLPKEIALGLKCLLPEIKIVDPNTVILLGATAQHALLAHRTERGVLYEGKFRNYIATYHPGYLLDYRHPELLPKFKEHLMIAMENARS